MQRDVGAVGQLPQAGADGGWGLLPDCVSPRNGPGEGIEHDGDLNGLFGVDGHCHTGHAVIVVLRAPSAGAHVPGIERELLLHILDGTGDLCGEFDCLRRSLNLPAGKRVLEEYGFACRVGLLHEFLHIQCVALHRYITPSARTATRRLHNVCRCALIPSNTLSYSVLRHGQVATHLVGVVRASAPQSTTAAAQHCSDET